MQDKSPATPMEMGCSECDCKVEAGKRVVVCSPGSCCCADVPVAGGARELDA